MKVDILFICISLTFRPQIPPTVQVHYNGRHHWVTSFQERPDSSIYIMDSLYSSMTTNLWMQLAKIYGVGKKSLSVKICTSLKQSNGSDCGLFALANVVEFLEGGLSSIEDIKWNFNADQIRDHLLSCLEAKDIAGFPKIEDNTMQVNPFPTFVRVSNLIIFSNYTDRVHS